MSKKVKSPAVETAPVAPETIGFQSAPEAAPVATIDAPVAGTIVEGLTPEEARETARVKKFVGFGRNAALGENLASNSVHNMACMLLEVASENSLGMTWTEVHATKLPPAIRVFHRGLIATLEDMDYSNPKQMWKRIRLKAVQLVEEAEAQAKKDAGIVEPEEAESTREKIRRLCEDDIQKMYSRIYKAARSNETDVDIDIMALMPMLVDMAESIGFNLAIPEMKGN